MKIDGFEAGSDSSGLARFLCIIASFYTYQNWLLQHSSRLLTLYQHCVLLGPSFFYFYFYFTFFFCIAFSA